MSNSPRHNIYYKPRYTDDQAFDLCSPLLREAISISVIEWCCRTLLKMERKHGTFYTIGQLKRWNDSEASFINEGKGKNKKVIRTTHIECDVKPIDDLKFVVIWMKSATNRPTSARDTGN